MEQRVAGELAQDEVELGAEPTGHACVAGVDGGGLLRDVVPQRGVLGRDPRRREADRFTFEAAAHLEGRLRLVDRGVATIADLARPVSTSPPS